MLHRPGELLQLERAALPDAAVPGAGKPAGIEKHRGEPRRIMRRERTLNMCAIGQPQRADAAIAPGLPDDPLERVDAVLAFRKIFGEDAFRPEAAAAILENVAISHPREGGRDLGLRARRRIGQTAIGVVGAALVIGRAFEEHRERPVDPGRYVDISRKPNAVAHRDHDIALNEDIGPGISLRLDRRDAHRAATGT